MASPALLPSDSMLGWKALQRHEILPITADIARRAGEMRRDFLKQGITRQPADMLIAATAQIHGLTLVTRNIRDFEGCGIGLLNPFSADS